MPSGEGHTPRFYVKARTPGEASVTPTNIDYAPTTFRVTVVARAAAADRR